MAPHQVAHPNKAGFTLVEVLVSLVILAVGLLGSLVGVMAVLNGNLGNLMREEAVKIAQERAEQARNMPYASIQNIVTPATVNRTIRKATVPFTVTTTRTAATGYGTSEMQKVNIKVAWKLKSSTHSYTLETIVRQQK